jgi:membrane protease YdiL (CAAX protease family)
MDATDATSLTSRERRFSLVEFVVGACIVIGHNVYHVVPNEVPILFILGIVSIRLREGSFRAIGLSRPRSWPRTILMAALTAAAVIAMGEFVTEPLAASLGLHNTGKAAGALVAEKGNIAAALKGLLLVWTFAAFGEEISYRRYLLGRAADGGGASMRAYWLALPVVAVLFGIGHWYQGPAGVFTTAGDGMVIGAAYLLSRRNLWVAVLAHGFVDTAGILLLFFGLAN